jgi:hypothetical protein
MSSHGKKNVATVERDKIFLYSSPVLSLLPRIRTCQAGGQRGGKLDEDNARSGASIRRFESVGLAVGHPDFRTRQVAIAVSD